MLFCWRKKDNSNRDASSVMIRKDLTFAKSIGDDGENLVVLTQAKKILYFLVKKQKSLRPDTVFTDSQARSQ